MQLTPIPDTMRAAAIDRFGPPSELKLHQIPVPMPGPDEVLIEVHAAEVGSWDAKLRDSSWASGDEKFPLVLGADGSGIVVAKGARVRRFEIGDLVYAYDYPYGGFYAEYAAVDASHVGRVPRRLDPLHAATQITAATAQQGIDDWLRIRRGDSVLVFGASGAVGTLAIQFARRKGARVIATATGRDSHRLVHKLGAKVVLDARAPDFVDKLRDAAQGGFDAVLALAGGPALEQAIDLLGPQGRVAYPNGVEPEPRRRRQLKVTAYNGEVGPRELARLERAVDEAELEVPIAAVYPLAQAARAHARLEKGHVLGRIALRIRRPRQPARKGA